MKRRSLSNGNSSRSAKAAEVTLLKLRSAISNGSTLLPDVDHRSAWMRRLRDLISDHVADLGGEHALSSAERMLVRRASMLCLQCEMIERRWDQTEGEASAKSLETYQRCTNTLRRTLESLGLQRRAKDVTPSLSEYLEAKEAAE